VEKQYENFVSFTYVLCNPYIYIYIYIYIYEFVVLGILFGLGKLVSYSNPG
jgi:hypothetical protein